MSDLIQRLRQAYADSGMSIFEEAAAELEETSQKVTQCKATVYRNCRCGNYTTNLSGFCHWHTVAADE